MITVARNSNTGRSRTSRSHSSWITSTARPHPEQTGGDPRFRRTHSFSFLAGSSISCRQTRYPGQLNNRVQSLSSNPSDYKIQPAPSLASVEFLLRADLT
jgi:hypothetical protein